MSGQIIFKDTWCDLEREQVPLTSSVKVSDLALLATKTFDYATDGTTAFYPFQLPDLPKDFGIGLIVGSSGSGKSSLLKNFGAIKTYDWGDGAIVDHFDSAEEATEKLYAVGLNSIPTWMKPYGVLSNGEKFRADLAIMLKNHSVIDEFTSVVDRNVAMAASKSLHKYVADKNIKNVVLASCHRDVIPYLKPDWIIDTDAEMFVIQPSECLRQEPMVTKVFEVEPASWAIFAKHHYLKSDLSPFSRCFIATVDESPAAFYAVISYPSGTVRNAFRGHRLVTLPDFQGLGIAPRLADFIANGYVSAGKRFFAKTAHPRLGEWRERSGEWKPTSKNKKYRTDAVSDLERQLRRDRFVGWEMNPDRFTYSHEFIVAAEESN
jgi:hypothetical protein